MLNNAISDNRIMAEADRLTVSFRSKKGGSVLAVDNISFSLRQGETLAVVGESGSGKTTLMRTMLRLIEPDSGAAALFGKRLHGLSDSELTSLRRRCGYMPQDPYGAIPPGLSALDAVCEPDIIAGAARTRDETRERAKKLLRELGLCEERIWRSRAVALSGGQRQRVEIARALMLSPELLLCDEPTSMQDVSTRGDIIEILRKYAVNGGSMLFITHDLLLAAKIADRVLVLKNGRLCEECKSADIMVSPRHPYTATLMDAVPRLKKITGRN